MPFTIEQVPDAPIVTMVYEGRQSPEELQEVIAAVEAALDVQPEPVFLVMDIRGLGLGLDDLTSAANISARGSGAVLHHPNIRENLVVSDKAFFKLAAQGLRTATFGNVKLRVFETQEQALDYCRETIAETTNR